MENKGDKPEKPVPEEPEVISSPKLAERGPTDRGKRTFDVATNIAMLQRVEQAKRDGAVNIAVGVDFLLELLTGCQRAMRDTQWKSKLEV